MDEFKDLNRPSRRRSSRSHNRENKQAARNIIAVSVAIALLLCIGGMLYYLVIRPDRTGPNPSEPETTNEAVETESQADPSETEGPGEFADVLEAARFKKIQYDYDGAVQYVKEQVPGYENYTELTDFISECMAEKVSLVKIDNKSITHVFFHILVWDEQTAFAKSNWSAMDYNTVMTTSQEFKDMMQEMYDRGYVMVSIHDIAKIETMADGSQKMMYQPIYLPEGKKAFVMSQDDVCYYAYMTGDGFATKMVIDEDGKPKCEYQKDDGTVDVGDYDLVPILDQFIEEHPDFSYRGAKACLAFTGYNGVLGYRTDDAYLTNEKFLAAHPDFDMEKEKQSVRDVAECLRKDGYELASHTWGHRNVGAISLADLQTDTDKWANRVESLIGKSDIILFPFGADIADWHPYNTADDRYQILYKAGFRYICNVDSNQYFVQYGDDYFRQGRRNLDGYRMYYDLPESNPTKSHLDDLFDVNEVFDRSRPTPVPPMGHETKGVGNVTAGH